MEKTKKSYFVCVCVLWLLTDVLLAVLLLSCCFTRLRPAPHNLPLSFYNC